MYLIRSMCIALSTYSAVPVPRFEWDEKSMRFAICFLPAVGLVCGGALYALNWACAALGLPRALFASVAAVLPLMVTGGIHMDGFMDTSDALSSHQSRERKLEIMKDSHCGAFAAMRCCMYMLLSFGFYYAIFDTVSVLPVCVGFVLSRGLCAISALTLPNARKGGMLACFTQHAQRKGAVIAMCAVCAGAAIAMIASSPLAGGTGALFALIMLLWYRKMAMRQFGGATGDTSGYFIQCCELALLMGAAAGGII